MSMSREDQLVKAIKQRQLLYGSKPFTIKDAHEQHEKLRKSENWTVLPEKWEPLARSVLRTLESMGLVSRVKNGRYRFSATISLEPNSPQADLSQLTSDGGQPPDSPSEPSGNGQGGGGAGYREVLSHPYLFSYPKKDFDHLLDQLSDRS